MNILLKKAKAILLLLLPIHTFSFFPFTRRNPKDYECWKQRNYTALGLKSGNILRDIFSYMFILSNFPEFRNVVYKRLKNFGAYLNILLPRLKSLYICTDDIGDGLYIQHGFSTIIGGTIGTNCHINQQVTIGYTAKGAPNIGNNVTISAGAIIVGDVTIGDNSIIGAGTTVTKSVPAGSVVVGPSFRILERAGAMNR